MKEITLAKVTSDHADFTHLCRELDHFLNMAVGGEEKREKYKSYNYAETLDYVIIAYHKKRAVGCAALRRYSDTEVEVKRVFVREEYRGQNIGGKLLEKLILQAKELGYSRMILETGEILAASVHLYSKYGFERIKNYGPYVNMQESLCMGRDITDDAIIFCEGKVPSADDIQKLYYSVNWISGNYAEQLELAFKTAGTVISAWHGQQLVGLIEALDDGAAIAYIHYLLVNPVYQKTKIGSHMIDMVKRKYKDYLFLIVLSEKRETVPFYEKLGFTISESVTPLHIANLY